MVGLLGRAAHGRGEYATARQLFEESEVLRPDVARATGYLAMRPARSNGDHPARFRQWGSTLCARRTTVRSPLRLRDEVQGQAPDGSAGDALQVIALGPRPPFRW
jgi:hypothetical protein